MSAQSEFDCFNDVITEHIRWVEFSVKTPVARNKHHSAGFVFFLNHFTTYKQKYLGSKLAEEWYETLTKPLHQHASHCSSGKRIH